MSGDAYQWDLSDIDPREVSLVDHAANKKKFVLVKREGGPDMKGSEMGLEEIKGQTIPPPVLKAVIKMTQSAIEDLISLASTLEGMQKGSDGESDEEEMEKQKKGPLPSKIAAEFRKVIGILESVLQKYPSATQKNKEGDVNGNENEGAKPPEEAQEETKNAFFEKAFKDLESQLGELKNTVESLEKKTEESKETGGEGANEDEVQKGDKGETPEINLDKIKEEVTKALDERAKKLVSMFQEAAKEEFAEFTKMAKEVAEIKKALGESGDDEEEGAKPKSERTYGMEEEDRDITNGENPFVSIFESVKDF